MGSARHRVTAIAPNRVCPAPAFVRRVVNGDWPSTAICGPGVLAVSNSRAPGTFTASDPPSVPSFMQFVRSLQPAPAARPGMSASRPLM